MDWIQKWFGAERLQRDERTARRFWAGEGRCVASLTAARCRSRQDAGDAERLADWRAGLEEQAGLPGLNAPSVFPDFGTISVPRYWGGTVVVPPETGCPFIQPVAATLEEALPLTPRAVDDPAMDGARALRLYLEISASLATDRLWFRTPDMQGPLNTAGLILDQQALLMALYDAPDRARTFLQRVADFIIALWRYLRRASGARLCGSIWPYIFFPAELGLVMTEDLMPLLSADLYAQAGIPLLQAINRAAGGLHIHCCGDWGRHAPNLAQAGLTLRSVEFNYPFTQPEALECLAERTVFVPAITLNKQSRFRSVVEYYRHLLQETDARYRFWFACSEDTEEARAFVSEAQALE